MIQDLKLEEQNIETDYGKWNKYYNHSLTCFYATRLAKQCYRFNKPFPLYIDFSSLHTDKFVLTDTYTHATITRNIKDTHWVEDTYYQIARYIYNNEVNKEEVMQYLIDNKRSKTKPFAMQWLVGAIEASNVEQLQTCLDEMRSIEWAERNW